MKKKRVFRHIFRKRVLTEFLPPPSRGSKENTFPPPMLIKKIPAPSLGGEKNPRHPKKFASRPPDVNYGTSLRAPYIICIGVSRLGLL